MKIGLANTQSDEPISHLGVADRPTEYKRVFTVIDTETGAVVENVAKFVWGTGWAINGRMDREGDLIRSWPEPEKTDADRIFDSELDPELDPEQDYLLLAIPCSSAMVGEMKED